MASNNPETWAETAQFDRLKENFEKVEQLSRRLVGVMASKPVPAPALDSPNQEPFAPARCPIGLMQGRTQRVY